ncbi:MAG TPA: serine/threonine-protein kinase [Ktedonobacteraceae bacterium]
MQEIHQRTLPLGSILRERYRIEGLLGKGGYGSVYLVRDLRVRGNLFALKETNSPNRKDQQRFLFEGELLKKLDHGALPRVYRVFDDDTHQRMYMLMDYIEGPNLEALRRQRPDKRFTLSQVLTVLAPVMDAVQFLHSQQPPILHRDIKPSNIIVPLSGDDAVLVDFGIAKEFVPDGTTTAFRTGSPGYASPEQYSRGTSARSDIYGMGATLYNLLTGTLPADALDRMTKTSNGEPDPLVPVHTLVPGTPQSVSKAVAKAMALNSNDRFATIEQFWQEFAVCQGWRPLRSPDAISSAPAIEPASGVLAGITPVPSDVVTSKRRRPLLSGRLLLILLALLLAAGSFAGAFFYLQGHHGASAALPTPTVGVSTATVQTSPVTAQNVPTVVAISPTVGKTPVPTKQPVVLPTVRPTLPPPPPPTPRPTTTPFPTPRPTPSPTPVLYPQIGGAYNGTIDDTTSNIITGMSLSIQQKAGQGNISGSFTVNPPLVGNGNFTGTVNTVKYVQFTVQSYHGNAPLYFWGWVQADGSLLGNYCSVNAHNQCDSNAGASGTWHVAPAAGSALDAPPSFRL